MNSDIYTSSGAPATSGADRQQLCLYRALPGNPRSCDRDRRHARCGPRARRGGETGRRRGLKILRPQGHRGSTPLLGTAFGAVSPPPRARGATSPESWFQNSAGSGPAAEQPPLVLAENPCRGARLRANRGAPFGVTPTGGVLKRALRKDRASRAEQTDLCDAKREAAHAA